MGVVSITLPAHKEYATRERSGRQQLVATRTRPKRKHTLVGEDVHAAVAQLHLLNHGVFGNLKRPT